MKLSDFILQVHPADLDAALVFVDPNDPSVVVEVVIDDIGITEDGLQIRITPPYWANLYIPGKRK